MYQDLYAVVLTHNNNNNSFTDTNTLYCQGVDNNDFPRVQVGFNWFLSHEVPNFDRTYLWLDLRKLVLLPMTGSLILSHKHKA